MPRSPSHPLLHPLILCGVVAGPLYVIVSLAQALTRPGFDLTRHAWSLLANGPGGWVQVTNLLATGVLVLAAAYGLARSTGLRGAPVLLGVFGLGMLAAGIFRTDPMAGFPLGTPDGPPTAPTTSGLLHLATAGVGFLALVAATWVLARWFARRLDLGLSTRRRWAGFSVVTGIVFLVAFAGLASGSSAAPVVLGFVAAIVLAFGWLTAVCTARLLHRI